VQVDEEVWKRGRLDVPADRERLCQSALRWRGRAGRVSREASLPETLQS
jgi:hypothetical protein